MLNDLQIVSNLIYIISIFTDEETAHLAKIT